MLTVCQQCGNEYTKKKFAKKAYNFCSKKCTRKNHYNKNIQKMRKEKIEYGKHHKMDKAKYDIEYRQANKEKIAKYKHDWCIKQQKTNIIYRIKRNIRRRIHHALIDNIKSAHTMELLGCTIEEFKKHIESQWVENMSSDNYGTNGWHIDHILECHTVDLSQPEEQKKCFHYTNQRPLWAKDNLTRPRPKLNKQQSSIL